MPAYLVEKFLKPKNGESGPWTAAKRRGMFIGAAEKRAAPAQGRRRRKSFL